MDGAARQPTETLAARRKVTLERSADCQKLVLLLLDATRPFTCYSLLKNELSTQEDLMIFILQFIFGS